MKVAVIMALAGLGAAAPAVIEDETSTIATFTIGHRAVRSTATSTPPTPVGSSPSEDKTNTSLDPYSRLAQEETAPYPYNQVFTDQNATAIHQPIASHRTSTYDAEACAAHCNLHRACQSFGIFIERQLSCSNCSNPTSTEANMCALYNTPLDELIITNTGASQATQNQTFTRFIRASNGYNKPVSAGATMTVTVTITSVSQASPTLTRRTLTSTDPPFTLPPMDPFPPIWATRSSIRPTTTVFTTRFTSTLTRTRFRTRTVQKDKNPGIVTVTVPGGVTATTATSTRTRIVTGEPFTWMRGW